MLESIRFMPSIEYIFWITKELKTPKFNPKAFIFSEVWDIMPDKNNEHPASFPNEIVRRCIFACSDENDVVLDPFMGSGTTGVVAKNMNRRFIGFEISKDYMDICNKRLQQDALHKWDL